MQRVIKYNLIFILTVVCISFTAPAFSTVFAPFTGEISADSINLRVDATVSSAVICVLNKGQLVEVVSEVYEWYKVRLPKEAPSYVKKRLLECIDINTVNPGACSTAKVIKDRVNIRLAPSESSWILGKADKLTVVNILEDAGGWCKIVPIHQSYGWVNKKFVNLSSKEPELSKQEVESPKTAQPVEAAQSASSLIIEGTVSPYGVVLWRKATHKLVTAKDEVYFLKGNRKSLNNLNYHKVRVTGKLISPDGSKNPVIETDIIEALD